MKQAKYCVYSDSQLSATKQYIRKQIFYLLLYVDPKTSIEYPNVDVTKAFQGLQYKLGGLNSILFEPPALVTVMSLLEAALLEYNSNGDFDFSKYRKLILDAGNEVIKIDDSKVDFEQVLSTCEKVEESMVNKEVI